MSRLRACAYAVLVGAAITAFIAVQLPAPSSSADADAAPTQPGSAFASAVVVGINPQYGGLSLVVRGGQSTASYTETQSVASSQAVNLGYVGGLLNGPPNACYGGSSSSSSTAALNALEATSASGASSTTADHGVESVSANPSPESADATTSLAPVSVPGLLTVTAHSTTHVNYASGKDQDAEASTTMSISLLNGVVSLNGLNWTATQETGSTSEAAATFSMTSVTVAGKTTVIATPADLVSAITAVNKVLLPAGMTLTQPASSTDVVTGTQTIGPLQLGLTGTAVTNTILGKLNPTETTLEEDLGKVLAEGSGACLTLFASYVGDGVLIAGIVEGILAGGGFINVDLGGASADTQAAPNFIDPLGGSGFTPGNSNLDQNVPAVSPGFAASGGLGASLFGGSAGLPVSGATATTVPASPQVSPATAEPAVLVHCVSSSGSGRPGCWSGAATVGAAVLLAAGGALFAADIVRSRRRLSRPKETL